MHFQLAAPVRAVEVRVMRGSMRMARGHPVTLQLEGKIKPSQFRKLALETKLQRLHLRDTELPAPVIRDVLGKIPARRRPKELWLDEPQLEKQPAMWWAGVLGDWQLEHLRVPPGTNTAWLAKKFNKLQK